MADGNQSYTVILAAASSYDSDYDGLNPDDVAVTNTDNDSGVIDSDGDGVPDDQDAFPDDPNEWLDTDGDGTGNNEDTDDDNDGMPDVWEEQYGLNPLVNDASGDMDGDGISNIDEYNTGTDPTQPPDNCSPDQPALSSPDNEDTNVSLTPELLTEAFYDPDNGDTHARTQWQISTASDFSDTEKCVFDIENNSHLVSLFVPDLILDADMTYYWRVRFYDNHNNGSEWSSPYSFTTLAAFYSDDQDEDGVPDNQQVDSTVDLDGNGVSDIDQDDIKSVNAVAGNIQIGVKGSSNVASIDSVKFVDPDIIDPEGSPKDIPLGLIGFKLSIDNPGDIAEVIVYFSEVAPSGTRWYKYDLVDGWQDYSDHANFSTDRRSVTLELEDGGYGDVDGVANGVIVDPSGVISNGTSDSDNINSSGSSGGGGGGGSGCFIATAAFGSKIERHVKILCEFRDRYLLRNKIGRGFADFYYRHSPPLADCLRAHPSARIVVRYSLIPIIWVAYLALHAHPATLYFVFVFLVMAVICCVRHFHHRSRGRFAP